MRESGSTSYSSHLRLCLQHLAQRRRDRPWVPLVRITNRTTSGLQQARPRYRCLVRYATSARTSERQEAARTRRLAHPGRRPTPEDLVGFLSGRVAPFMVPRYVEIVDELAKDPDAEGPQGRAPPGRSRAGDVGPERVEGA